MEGGNYTEMSLSVPQRFFDEGYDIWIEGNRGTIWQRDHTDADITAEEYWDFSFYDMATQDIMAEVEYILGATGEESLSFVGYSMSTAQMIYAVGMQEEMDDVKNTLAKVDNALLITPCPLLTQYMTAGEAFNNARKIVANYIEDYENSGLLYLYGDAGEGFDYETYKEIECEYNEVMCPYLDLFADFIDTISLKSMMQYNMNSSEGAMLKDYFESYGKSKYPKDSDFIDFLSISTGPSLFGFAMTFDMTCPVTGAIDVAEQLSTFARLDQMDYCYSYNEFEGVADPHGIGLLRGGMQTKFMDSMVTTLKENTTALRPAPPAYVEPIDDDTDTNESGALSGIQNVSLYGAALGALVYLNLH